MANSIGQLGMAFSESLAHEYQRAHAGAHAGGRARALELRSDADSGRNTTCNVTSRNELKKPSPLKDSQNRGCGGKVDASYRWERLGIPELQALEPRYAAVTLRKACASGELPAAKVKGRWEVAPDAYERWARERANRDRRASLRAANSTRFELSDEERAFGDRFVAWFNAKARKFGITRAQRQGVGHAKRIAKLLRAGYTERDLRLVCVYALAGPEDWASQPRMRAHLSLRTLLKSQSPQGNRVFENYLEDAEAWAAEEFGEHALESSERPVAARF